LSADGEISVSLDTLFYLSPFNPIATKSQQLNVREAAIVQSL